jgi:membrane protein required for colicin V production
MNAVDIVLVVVFALCALRGYWRGFFREFFGLLGLAVGGLAAVRFAPEGVQFLEQHLTLPEPILAGVAFAGIFVIVHTAVNIIGLLFDRLAKAIFLSGINRFAGAVFAAGKGAVVMALLLFGLHLFQRFPELDQQIMSSTIGRPLVQAAGELINAAQTEAQDKT